MTVTIGRVVTCDYYVACDEPDCGAAYQRDAGSVDELVKRLTAAGWTIRAGSYCPTHSRETR